MKNLDIFISKSVISCESDNDCGYLNYCNEAKLCQHQDLTFGLTEIISYILIVIIVGFANVGGIGGGILKLPILVLLLNFSLQEATFLSYPILFGILLFQLNHQFKYKIFKVLIVLAISTIINSSINNQNDLKIKKGGVISNIVLLINQRHPRKNRPIIDFNLALILVPSVLLGTILGVFMNMILSELILSIAFFIFLCCVSPYLFIKARSISLKETYDKEEKESSLEKETPNETTSKISKSNMELLKQNSYITEPNQEKRISFDQQHQQEQNIQYYEVLSQNSQDNSSDGSRQGDDKEKGKKKEQIVSKELNELIDEEKQKIPVFKCLLLGFMLLVVTLLGLAKGGKGLKSVFGVEKCEPLYNLLTALQVVSCLLLSILVYIQQKNEYEHKVILRYEFDEEEIRFSPASFLIISFCGLLAGSITGMLGMGSGLIVLPVLLYLGCNTRASSATSGFMYFFIGGISIVYILIEGVLSYKIVLFYAALAILGGVLISNPLYHLVNKYNWQSLIVWIIFVIALVNLASTPYYVYIKSKENGWESLNHIKSYCD